MNQAVRNRAFDPERWCRTFARRWFAIQLWKRILAGLVVGALLGLATRLHPDPAAAAELLADVRVLGDIFVRLIRMLVVPLVAVTLVSGIVSLGNFQRLGSVGAKACTLYVLSTAIAGAIGLGTGLLMRPGSTVTYANEAAKQIAAGQPLSERLIEFIPQNPIAALADGQLLSIILFAVLLGVGILSAGRRASLLGDMFQAANEALLRLTGILMELAPIGVFALIAHTAGTQGADTYAAIFTLLISLCIGALLQVVAMYGALLKFVLRLPPVNFFRGISEAQLIAFSTASSAAAMPVLISNASQNLGVAKAIAGSVLPLGTTINMNGTALYLGLLATFAAQAFGYQVRPQEYVWILLSIVFVSIASPGVPSASLFMLGFVLEAFGVSQAHIALMISLTLPFDRLPDMLRTLVNVTGNAAVVTAVAKWSGALDQEHFRRGRADPPGEVRS